MMFSTSPIGLVEANTVVKTKVKLKKKEKEREHLVIKRIFDRPSYSGQNCFTTENEFNQKPYAQNSIKEISFRYFPSQHTTSFQRFDVASTYIQRRYNVMCRLG